MTSENAGRRTLQKVRRDSRPVGTCETDLWRPTNAKAKALALRAAERFDLAHKPKGQRNGPLGHVGLEIYRALWSRVRFSDGCLCPSIEWLMKACRRSRAAVVGALRRLRAKGFVTWRRRLEYTGGPPGGRGPPVKQATNAYALGTPADALQLVPAGLVPDDERTRLAEVAAFFARCEADAFNLSSLGATFARWGERLSNNASLSGARNPSLGSDLLKGGTPAAS